MDKELRRRNIRDKVQLTWFTPEPFLGHFGIGGITGGQTMLEAFMKMYNIKWYTNTCITKIEKDTIHMNDGNKLAYKMAMIMPPFVGTEVMKHSPELVDEKGFVVCNEGYQHITYKNVYAVGLAVEVLAPLNALFRLVFRRPGSQRKSLRRLQSRTLSVRLKVNLILGKERGKNSRRFRDGCRA